MQGYGIFVLSGNTLESNQRQAFEHLPASDKIEGEGQRHQAQRYRKGPPVDVQELLRCAGIWRRHEHDGI